MTSKFRLASLAAYPQVAHGFIGRHGGLADIQALHPDLIMSEQAHGTRIYDVQKPLSGLQIVQGFDGLVTQQSGAALVIKMADCAPLLFYDPVTQTVAAAHAGRRGTEQGIARKMIEHLAQEYLVTPADLLVCIGPAICVKCYQIDRDKDLHYDLRTENKKQLLSAGVQNIELSDLCPACNAQDDFYSYRRENTKARNFAFLYLKPV